MEEPPSTIGKEKLEDTPVNEEGAVLCLCISARSIREEAGLLVSEGYMNPTTTVMIAIVRGACKKVSQGFTRAQP